MRRPGDNLYTCSIVALNADTGKLVWAFQPGPHDTHDWDAAGSSSVSRWDVQWEAAQNGDSSCTERLLLCSGSDDGGEPVNDYIWATELVQGVDKRGEPIPNPDKDPAPDGRLVAPDENGLTNYRSPSFDPKTELFLLSTHPSYSIYFTKPADGTFGWAGADYSLWGKGVLKAIDYKTGQIRWTHELGEGRPGAGVLTTESGIAFTGDVHGNFLALNTSDGKTLWHAGLGSSIQILQSPMNWMDGSM